MSSFIRSNAYPPIYPMLTGVTDYNIEPIESVWESQEPLAESSGQPSHPEPWLQGRLRKRIEQWRSLTSDPEILNLVENGWQPMWGWCKNPTCFHARRRPPAQKSDSHYKCSRCSLRLCEDPPNPKYQPNKQELQEGANAEFVAQAISQLVARGVARYARPGEVSIIAPLGISTQKNGKQRLFYACCYLNKHLLHLKFKYESMRKEGREVFRSDNPSAACGYAIDIMSAFHHVDVHTSAQRFLGFRDLQGRTLVFTSLPFGVSNAPRIFTMLLRAPVTSWRAHLRARFIHLLDDFSGSEDSFHQATKVVHYIVAHLEALGFIIQPEKVVVGERVFTALGFKIDLPLQRFFVPDQRIEEIVAQAQKIINLRKKNNSNARIIRALDLLSLAGKIISGDIAIGPKVRIFTRPLYAAIYEQLRNYSSSPSNLYRFIRISDTTLSTLSFWSDKSRWAFSGAPITSPHRCSPPHGIIASDASESGYGSVLRIKRELSLSPNVIRQNYAFIHKVSRNQADAALSAGIELADILDPHEMKSSSTMREGLGVLKSFTHFAPLLRNSYIHLHIDSQCLAFVLGGIIPRYDNNTEMIPTNLEDVYQRTLFPHIYGGSSVQLLQSLAEEVYTIADQFKFSFTPVWGPRRMNTHADYLSKVSAENYSDYTLPSCVLQHLERYWNITFEIDVFSTAHSARCQRFFSRFYHPAAEGIDAFKIQWPRNTVLWLHPPPAIITTVMSYAEAQKAQGVIIIPQWPRHVFYQKFLGPASTGIPLPRSKSQGGPHFIQDTYRLGLAQELYYYPRTPPPNNKPPKGILWAIKFNFDHP